MFGQHEALDVFATPDFWQPSKWLKEQEEALAPASTRLTLDTSDDFKSSLRPDADGDSSIFFGTGFLKGDALFEETPKDDTVCLEYVDDKTAISADETLFDDDFEYPASKPAAAAVYKSWKPLPGVERKPCVPRLIAESGTGVYEALIAQLSSNRNVDSPCIDPRSYCSSLLDLCFGRASLLFSDGKGLKGPQATIPSIRIAGYSRQVLGGVEDLCFRCGKSVRTIQAFSKGAYVAESSPCAIALASALEKVLRLLEMHVFSAPASSVSILQLRAVIDRVCDVTRTLEAIVAKASRARSDEQVLEAVFAQARLAEYRGGRTRDMMREILQRASQPWFRFLEEWIGTRDPDGLPLSANAVGHLKYFVGVEMEARDDGPDPEDGELQFSLEMQHMPSFIPGDLAKVIFEAGRNFRFILSRHPGHLLSGSPTCLRTAPGMSWTFDWTAVVEREQDVKTYQDTMVTALQQKESPSESVEPASISEIPQSVWHSPFQVFGRDKDAIETSLFESMKMLAEPISETAEDPLSAIIDGHLKDEKGANVRSSLDSTPHWSLLPLLSFGNAASVQAKLVNRESLRLILEEHGLRSHLGLLRSFMLMGDGMFCSRLVHALFDPDTYTAEREAGAVLQGGAQLGLRLVGRENWPPASSELRLALMGLLSECYASLPGKATTSSMSGAAHFHDTSVLPGDLSFAIRELSPEAIDKCQDPSSLEALDFLRLSYKTPQELGLVITPRILEKYDRIFQHMLRITGVMYAANQISRSITSRTTTWRSPENSAVRFSAEASHFVSSICSHFLESGIEAPWRQLEATLDETEADLRDGSSESWQNFRHSPDRLRECHQKTLDNMSEVLLLRKRQRPVLKILQDILRLILVFAKHARCMSQAAGQRMGQIDPGRLYGEFRDKVHLFLTVCRGMTDAGQSYRSDRGSYAEAVGRLVARIDLGGFYSR